MEVVSYQSQHKKRERELDLVLAVPREQPTVWIFIDVEKLAKSYFILILMLLGYL
jgi:hypothetical protein